MCRHLEGTYCLHTTSNLLHNKKLQHVHSQTVTGSDEIESELGHVARTGCGICGLVSPNEDTSLTDKAQMT